MRVSNRLFLGILVSLVSTGCAVAVPNNYTRTTQNKVEQCHVPFQVIWPNGAIRETCDGQNVVIQH
jgi:hypothetical protein